MRDLGDIFHSGELQAQALFNDGMDWSKNSLAGLNRMFKEAVDDETAYFIEGQRFFFISTSSSEGECDCSFRGIELDDSGKALQCVFVPSPKVVIFPDYSGNRIYNSLGNIIDNPSIGMLFIDFRSALRLRVNGGASIITDKDQYKDIWPKALRYIKVDVKQVYYNCSKRIKESVSS